MSEALSAPWGRIDERRRGRQSWLLFVLLALGVVATAAVTVITNGNVVAAVTPVLAVAFLAVLWHLPLRLPLLVLLFFGLALDATSDGPWDSPVAPIGHILLHNLNKTVPISALAFPLLALVLVYLLVIHVHRLLSASLIDAEHTPPARPLIWGLGVSLLTVAGLMALGAKRGGDIQLAKDQVQNFVLMLVVAYAVAMSFRPKDYQILGGLILVAAAIKSLMALWVVYADLEHGFVFAVTHGDSLLFVAAVTVLTARFVERPGRRSGMLCLLFLPLILGGIWANNRRLAWVEVLAILIVFCVLTRRSPLKRALARAGLVALPVVLLYGAAGWDASSPIFAPVQTIRSLGDADVDRSTLFRDVENFNLVFTMTDNPIAGAGFGKPYSELIKGDDISFFKEYRYLPHNSVLGLWAFGGIIGFTGLWAALIVGSFLAARSYNFARSSNERIAALSAFTMLIVYEIQCWGDIGFSEPKSLLLVGPALALAAQLAFSTNAWESTGASPLSRRPA